MSKVEKLINDRIGKEGPDSPAISISFRGSEDIAIELAALTKVLGYSTRSKLLAELVQAALDDAVSKLPDEMHMQFHKEMSTQRTFLDVSKSQGTKP